MLNKIIEVNINTNYINISGNKIEYSSNDNITINFKLNHQHLKGNLIAELISANANKIVVKNSEIINNEFSFTLDNLVLENDGIIRNQLRLNNDSEIIYFHDIFEISINNKCIPETEKKIKTTKVKKEKGNVNKDKHYEHTQELAKKQWNIKHNLNKYPSVTIVDTSGNTVEGEVIYISKEKLTINFSNYFSGKAYLN